MQAPPVVLDWEEDAETTIVRLRSSSTARSVKLKDITPILDGLGFEIASFGVEKSPASHDSRFNITDAEGGKLLPHDVDRLLAALEQDLPMPVVRRHDTMHDTLRTMRSTSSNLPDTPAFSRQSKTVSWAALEQNSPASANSPAGSQRSFATEASGPSAAPVAAPVDEAMQWSPLSSQQHIPQSERQQPSRATDEGGWASSSGKNGVASSINTDRPEDEECDEPLWEGGLITPEDPVERIMSRPVRWIAMEADLSQAKALMTLLGDQRPHG